MLIVAFVYILYHLASFTKQLVTNCLMYLDVLHVGVAIGLTGLRVSLLCRRLVCEFGTCLLN